ncbi:MAG: FlgB family protein [Paracoccaceae bacterium]|jgi:flagellar basal-body rod protein FlgB|nr:FlgB family protein [Paracoccaceae bacterium]
MFGELQIFRMAQGLARHAAARQEAVARNVANVNTPGYKRVGIPDFATLYAHRATSGDGMGLRATRAGHLGVGLGYPAPAAREVAGAREAPNGNSVSLETEIMDAATLRRDHDMALAVYRSAMTVLRAGIGRR